MENQSVGNYPRESANQFWQSFVIRLVILVSIPYLIYVGYCFGLWGRNSLLFQYLFQCKCPSFSEEWRYPKDIDVIVSACNEGWVDLSPSGSLLYVREKKLIFPSSYLVNLKTKEKKDITDQPYAKFITDELGLIGYGVDSTIIDLTTGEQFPIQMFRYIHPDAQINGDADLIKLANALREVDDIYLIEDSDRIVALSSDFRNSPSKSFISSRFDIPGFNPDRLELFLRENNINFHLVTSFPEEAISPDRRFIARREGIFLAETDQKIVDGVSLWLRGWTTDAKGAIYSTRYGGPCLIPLYLPMADDIVCLIEVDRPVLLLKVPEEYLPSTETP